MTQKAMADPEVVEVSFTPTPADHVEALRANIRRSGRRWWAPVVLVAVLTLNIVTDMVKQGPAALLGQARLPLLVLVLGTAAYFGAPLLARQVIARRARREPGLLAPTTFRFAPDGVRVRTVDSATKLPWHAFEGVRETKHVFFFEVGTDASLFLPLRALSGPDQARLRTLLAARLGARARFHETNGR